METFFTIVLFKHYTRDEANLPKFLFFFVLENKGGVKQQKVMV